MGVRIVKTSDYGVHVYCLVQFSRNERIQVSIGGGRGLNKHKCSIDLEPWKRVAFGARAKTR